MYYLPSVYHPQIPINSLLVLHCLAIMMSYTVVIPRFQHRYLALPSKYVVSTGVKTHLKKKKLFTPAEHIYVASRSLGHHTERMCQASVKHLRC